jgi:hypothetical protein
MPSPPCSTRAFLLVRGIEGWEVAVDGSLVYSPSRQPVEVEILMAGKVRRFRLVEVP